MAPQTDWNPHLGMEFAKPYWTALQRFVTDERATHEVYPPREQVFAALHATALADVKVVILGQDPYHGLGQAHGLCFSVPPGVRVPPSLRNVFAELESDLGIAPPTSGSLDPWADQGVLLLNATLTVRAGVAGSHQGHGWEIFTDRVIELVNAKADPVVFILWGASARKKRTMLDRERHEVIESTHPSPLSARNGFFGSRPFSRTNSFLTVRGRSAVDWKL